MINFINLFPSFQKEREQYEFVVIDGKIMHKLTGYPLHTNNIKSSRAKWIFVMSTNGKLYIGQVSYDLKESEVKVKEISTMF